MHIYIDVSVGECLNLTFIGTTGIQLFPDRRLVKSFPASSQLHIYTVTLRCASIFFFFNTRFRARYPTESPLFPFVCIYSTLRLDTACLLACVTYRNNFVIDLSSYKKKAPPKESVVGSRWTHRDRAASPTLINSNDPRR